MHILSLNFRTEEGIQLMVVVTRIIFGEKYKTFQKSLL